MLIISIFAIKTSNKISKLTIYKKIIFNLVYD